MLAVKVVVTVAVVRGSSWLAGGSPRIAGCLVASYFLHRALTGAA